MKAREEDFLQIGSWIRERKIAHGFGKRGQGKGKNTRLDWRGKAVQEGEESFPLVSLRQVHGDRIFLFDGTVRKIEEIWQEEGDSLITRDPGFALGIFTADCLPIFLHDFRQQVIGVVHAGWRGTARGVAKKAVEKMKTIFHCQSVNILAAMGPCIGPCCYEVDRPVKEAFVGGGFPWESIARPRGQGKWSLDLYLANSLLLEAAGIRRENVEALKLCTSCERETFYSYRRGDKTRGRQLNFIALRRNASDPKLGDSPKDVPEVMR
jgi:YfiH family protein